MVRGAETPVTLSTSSARWADTAGRNHEFLGSMSTARWADATGKRPEVSWKTPERRRAYQCRSTPPLPKSPVPGKKNEVPTVMTKVV
jgi:hypothetical protein